jgi:hypothetical protein
MVGWISPDEMTKDTLMSRKIGYMNLSTVDDSGLEKRNNLVRVSLVSDSTLM